MPDTKITALAAITTVAPAADLFAIVDVSDNSMAASGTTKNITTNQILGAGGTATLASATITGDLTVDTSTLKVDSTNNRVGIVNATPLCALHIGTTGGTNKLAINTAIVNSGDIQLKRGGFIGFSNAADAGNSEYIFANAGALEIGVNASTRFAIASDGVCTWSNVGGIGGTAMTLNATGLGVGVASPATKLDVLGNAALTGTSGFKYLYFNLATDINSVRGAKIGKNYDSPFDLNIHATTSATGLGNEAAIKFFRNNTDVSMTLDSAGNCGIGVTPSAGKGCLQLVSGINFPATQVASSDANTLDDYVETTFSPTVVGSTTAGTASYSTQIGRATKVGRLVTFQIRVAYSGGTGTGNLRVASLPFTAGVGSVFAIYAENIALTASNYAVASMSAGNTFISVDQIPTGGGAAAAVPYDAAGDIQISGSYIV